MHACGAAGSGVEIARGATKPAVAEAIDASYFHGVDGLGDVCGTAFAYYEGKVTEEHAMHAQAAGATGGQDEECCDWLEPSATQAQRALCRLLAKAEAVGPTNPIDVVLVTLGPLTNLAGLIQCSTGQRNTKQQERIYDLLEHLSHIVIMGGSANGLGNVTRTAEFNINADAEAAHIVFSYPWSQAAMLPAATVTAVAPTGSINASLSCGTLVTAVSWDICKDAAVPWQQLDSLCMNSAHSGIGAPPSTVTNLNDGMETGYYSRCRAAGLSHTGTFLRSVCYLPFVTHREPLEPLVKEELTSENKRGSKGAVICDCLAVAVALAHDVDRGNGALVEEYSTVHVDVELQGTHTRGQTVVDFGHCYDGVTRCRTVRWVTKVDVNVYVNMLSRLFDTHT